VRHSDVEAFPSMRQRDTGRMSLSGHPERAARAWFAGLMGMWYRQSTINDD
jgi:hypothetical protein